LPTLRTTDLRSIRVAARIARACTLAFPLLLAMSAAPAATLTVGANGPIATIAQAARLARDGDVVEIAAGTYRGDVAVWLQKRLTIRGIGGTPILNASGQIAEGKAIWVIRDGDITIENVAFEGARAPARNGAGIRFERGKLTVRRCRFTDNENGILASNGPDSELAIEDSEFAQAPRNRGSLKHLLYVGRIGRFTLTGSRFHQGFEGHLVKSRARESHVSYNLLYDGAGGQAAYELEFPDGGVAVVIGNIIGQSSTTTNLAVVSYGAEGSAWPRNAIYLVNNTLLSDAAGAWFLRVATHRLPAGVDVVAAQPHRRARTFHDGGARAIRRQFPRACRRVGRSGRARFSPRRAFGAARTGRRAAGDRRGVAGADGRIQAASRDFAACAPRQLDTGGVPIGESVTLTGAGARNGPAGHTRSCS